MKTSFIPVVVTIGILVFAIFSSLFSLGYTSPFVASAGLMIVGLIGVLRRDYTWRPRFRVRQTNLADAANDPRPVGPAPDWTYTV